ncbi:hypothetical protein [Aliiroseovarius crassostreae]|uniref:hypothetical protein n=1 Tax=Aliiroseovarius crassostreae TaxID=154981 RepID=UPI001113E082|nr:hypothetical protein [Aliiroseovarius crassostreae]
MITFYFRQSHLFSEEVPFVDFSLGNAQLHCWRLFCFSRSHPVMVETVNLDEIDHHLRLVQVMTIPKASIPAGRGNRTLSRLDVAPDLVEIRGDAAQGCQTHQPGTPFNGHRRAICSQMDNAASRLPPVVSCRVSNGEGRTTPFAT